LKSRKEIKKIKEDELKIMRRLLNYAKPKVLKAWLKHMNESSSSTTHRTYITIKNNTNG